MLGILRDPSAQEEGLVKVIFVEFSRKLSNQIIKITGAEKSNLNLMRRDLMLRSLVSLIQFHLWVLFSIPLSFLL